MAKSLFIPTVASLNRDDINFQDIDSEGQNGNQKNLSLYTIIENQLKSQDKSQVDGEFSIK